MADGSQSAKPKRSVGRPSDFTQEIADEICERIAKGESVRTICADTESGWLPAERTVYRWLDERGEFQQQYARARERQADHYFAEIVEIADAPNATVGPDGEPILRDPQRDRLRVEARKWVASKLAPKRYGEKLALTGADGGAIQVDSHKTLDIRLLNDEERDVLRELLVRAQQRQLEGPGLIDGEFSEVSDGE